MVDSRFEFWSKHRREAQTAIHVADAHLLRIQTVGQLSLFATDTNVIPFPKRPVPRLSDIPDLVA